MAVSSSCSHPQSYHRSSHQPSRTSSSCNDASPPQIRDLIPMMRAVWGQASRPTARHHVYRQTNALNGFSIRPVTFNDAFGVFLAPFLAAATIINLSWKEKQKEDWDHRLAEIDREIEILRAREAEALCRIQAAASARKLTRRGLRSYSTAAVAPTLEAFSESTREESANKSHNSTRRDRSAVSQYLRDAKQSFPSNSNLDPYQDLRAEKRYVPTPLVELERLISTKLGLELLVQIKSGRHISQTDLVDDISESKPSPQQPADLLQKVEAVAKLERAARRDAAGHHEFIDFEYSDSKSQMSSDIWQISGKFKEGKISSTQVVEEISSLMTNSPTPPTLLVYTQVIEVFDTHDLRPFIPLVLATLRSGRLIIDEIAFDRILKYSGHCKDVASFDWCLHEITKVKSRIKKSQSWEWWRVNGELVPVPSSSNPRLLNTMIFAALSLGQLSRAEAWSSILRRAGFEGGHRANMIREFLYYYTMRFDWHRGRQWMQDVVSSELAKSDAFRSYRDFQSLILRMMSLCVACSKKDEYSEILKAAIDAHVRPPDIGFESKGLNDESTKAIIFDWNWMIDNQVYDRAMTDSERIIKFQESLRSTDLYKDVDSIEESAVPSTRSISRDDNAASKELVDQVEDLRRKLDEQIQAFGKLQALLDSQTEAMRREARAFRVQQDRMDGLQSTLEDGVSSNARYTQVSSILASSAQTEKISQLEHKVAELTRREARAFRAQEVRIDELHKVLQNNASSNAKTTEASILRAASTQTEKTMQLEDKVAGLMRLFESQLASQAQQAVSTSAKNSDKMGQLEERVVELTRLFKSQLASQARQTALLSALEKVAQAATISSTATAAQPSQDAFVTSSAASDPDSGYSSDAVSDSDIESTSTRPLIRRHYTHEESFSYSQKRLRLENVEEEDRAVIDTPSESNFHNLGAFADESPISISRKVVKHSRARHGKWTGRSDTLTTEKRLDISQLPTAQKSVNKTDGDVTNIILPIYAYEGVVPQIEDPASTTQQPIDPESERDRQRRQSASHIKAVANGPASKERNAVIFTGL